MITIVEHNSEVAGGRQDDMAAIADLCVANGWPVQFYWLHGRSIHPRYARFESRAYVRNKPNVYPGQLFIVATPGLIPHVQKLHAQGCMSGDYQIITWHIAPDRCEMALLLTDELRVEYWCNSQTMRELSNRVLPSIADRVHVIPSLRDYQSFVCRDPNREIDLIWIGYQRTFGDGTDKGWRHFADIASMNPNLKCVAISTDELTAPPPPPNVQAFINIERPMVAYLMSLARVHVQPSKVESAPVACIEAMAAGCVTVAYDAGSVKELLGGHGIITNPDHIANDVNKALLMPNGRFREDAIVHALSFDQELHRDTAKARIASKLKEHTNART